MKTKAWRGKKYCDVIRISSSAKKASERANERKEKERKIRARRGDQLRLIRLVMAMRRDHRVEPKRRKRANHTRQKTSTSW